MTPDQTSLLLLAFLHRRVFGSREVRAALDGVFSSLAEELRGQREPPYVSGSLPIHYFIDTLPKDLRPHVGQCRAFLLRGGARMEVPEIHHNSVQRLVSYRGRGKIHAGEPGDRPVGLVPRAIRSPGSGETDTTRLEQHWDVVPADTWHYPEADAKADWATVTFHSASENEIVEELWRGPWPLET